MNTLPIDELRALLAAVSKHGDWHLVEIETDLQQTMFLLDEAIHTLTGSFLNVHAELAAQQAMLKQCAATGQLSADDTASLDAHQARITQEIDRVITGMQFQDMTNQLLQRTVNRVNGLKSLLQALSSHQSPMQSVDENEEIRRFIMQLNQQFHQGSQHLSGHLRKSVSQQDMATGDIDLF